MSVGGFVAAGATDATLPPAMTISTKTDPSASAFADGRFQKTGGNARPVQAVTVCLRNDDIAMMGHCGDRASVDYIPTFLLMKLMSNAFFQ
jgi:hypothetical protein